MSAAIVPVATRSSEQMVDYICKQFNGPPAVGCLAFDDLVKRLSDQSKPSLALLGTCLQVAVNLRILGCCVRRELGDPPFKGVILYYLHQETVRNPANGFITIKSQVQLNDKVIGHWKTRVS